MERLSKGRNMGVVQRDSPPKDGREAWSEQGGEPQALGWACPAHVTLGPTSFPARRVSACTWVSVCTTVLWVLGCHVGAPPAEVPA